MAGITFIRKAEEHERLLGNWIRAKETERIRTGVGGEGF